MKHICLKRENLPKIKKRVNADIFAVSRRETVDSKGTMIGTFFG
jgi:hypothetical protein